jgi:hypothetical protein
MQVGICTHLICAIVLAPHGTPRSVVRARSARRPRLRPAAARIASNTLRTLMTPRRRGDGDAPAPSAARTGAGRCETRPHADRRAAARRHDDAVAMRVDGRRGPPNDSSEAIFTADALRAVLDLVDALRARDRLLGWGRQRRSSSRRLNNLAHPGFRWVVG